MEAKADTRNRLPLRNAEEKVLQCPSCDVGLNKFEVAQHCVVEMERLRQMQLPAASEVEVQAANGLEDDNTVERRKPWTVFQRVQRNRQTRLKQRSRKRPAAPPTEFPCPVCNVTYPNDEIQRHVERCIRRSNGVPNGREEHSSNDEDDGDEFEEYEWAGQKRIRVSSLLQGGYASIGVGQAINYQDEDEDLNVDEDDTQIYGPPQYGEADVIAPTVEQNCGNGEVDVTSYMRRLITGGTSTADYLPTVEALNSSDNGAIIAPLTDGTEEYIPNLSKDIAHGSKGTSSTTLPTLPTQNYQQVIESLKAKLRHYEAPSKFKCLICLDDYRNPAISVSCWHVHCEDCWLRSLGARKLCPQCNLITTPKDLRRIYL